MPPKDRASKLSRALGAVVREVRGRRGWSQEELSERAGLDRTYVSGLERGLRSPNLRTLDRVAAALEVKLSTLLAATEARLDSRSPAS
ncbi:MAG: helix-turn-helix transcriptional regulator [Rhodoglobus sp.]